MKNMINGRLIITNTFFLYIRQIFVLLVGLYTSRVVIKLLGISDFGIYNVIAGFVSLLAFFSSAMTNASNRFFSYCIAENDNCQLRKVFCLSIIFYTVVCLCIFAIFEIVGIFFFDKILEIPAERLFAAKVVFQISLFTFLITVVQTPFISLITSYEDMRYYAYISTIECIIKLTAVILLAFNNWIDDLIGYSIVIFLVSFVSFISYFAVCFRKYPEIRFSFQFDKILFKDIFRFVFWSLFGKLSGTAYNQGLSIVLNNKAGVFANGARAIAAQVNGAVVTFASHFSIAIQPQIIKSYSVMDYENCYSLVSRGIKFTFLLMYIFVLPLVLEMSTILNIWLNTVPEYTVEFCVFTLISVCIEVTSYSLDTVAQATGKIRKYETFVSVITLLNLPISVFLLMDDYKPYVITIVYGVLVIVSVIVRLILLKKIAYNFNFFWIVKSSFIPIFILVLCSLPIPLFLKSFIKNKCYEFIFVVLSSVALTIFFSFLILLNKNEKMLFKRLIVRKVLKR